MGGASCGDEDWQKVVHSEICVKDQESKPWLPRDYAHRQETQSRTSNPTIQLPTPRPTRRVRIIRLRSTMLTVTVTAAGTVILVVMRQTGGPIVPLATFTSFSCAPYCTYQVSRRYGSALNVGVGVVDAEGGSDAEHGAVRFLPCEGLPRYQFA